MIRITTLHFAFVVFVVGFADDASANCLNLPTNEEIARCAENMRSGARAPSHNRSQRNDLASDSNPQPLPGKQSPPTPASTTSQRAPAPRVSQLLAQPTAQQYRKSDRDEVIEAGIKGLIGGLVFCLVAGFLYLANKAIDKAVSAGSQIFRKANVHDFGVKAGTAVKAARDFANRNLKVCPYCAENIKKAARVCKHCGRDVA